MDDFLNQWTLARKSNLVPKSENHHFILFVDMFLINGRGYLLFVVHQNVDSFGMSTMSLTHGGDRGRRLLPDAHHFELDDPLPQEAPNGHRMHRAGALVSLGGALVSLGGALVIP